MLAELVLEPRARGACLDPGGARDIVDLEHPVEAAEVDRHRAGVSIADPRLDASDDAGAAAVGDRSQPLVGAPGEHLLDLSFVGGMGDEVRRVLDLAAEAVDHVAVRLPESVRNPLVGVGAEQARERPRRLDPRGWQLDRLQRHRLLDRVGAEAELLADTRRRRLELGPRELPVLEPPAPVLAARDGGLYQ